MTLKKIFDKIGSYNDSLDEIWRIDYIPMNLEGFLDEVLKFFELKDDFKDKFEMDYDMSRYVEQKNSKLNYIVWFMDHVKPFLYLAYKLGWDSDLKNALREGKLSEKAIKNMLDNFVNIHRHGRKRKFFPGELKEFQKFKEDFKNVIDYCKEVDKFDGKTTGSIRDFANALKEHDLTKRKLREYLLQLNKFEKDCSRSTKYRFDKDLIFIEKSRWEIESALERFDFYEKYATK